MLLKYNWSDIATKQGIKGTDYNKFKFIHTRTLLYLSCKVH